MRRKTICLLPLKAAAFPVTNGDTEVSKYTDGCVGQRYVGSEQKVIET